MKTELNIDFFWCGNLILLYIGLRYAARTIILSVVNAMDPPTQSEVKAETAKSANGSWRQARENARMISHDLFWLRLKNVRYVFSDWFKH